MTYIITHITKIVSDIQGIIQITKVNPINFHDLGYKVGDLIDIILLKSPVPDGDKRTEVE